MDIQAFDKAMIWIVSLLAINFCRMCGADRLPAYSVSCQSDAECGDSGAMKCFKDYVGCDLGTCGCEFGAREDGQCVELYDTSGCGCTQDVQCARGMECINRRCTCTGHMTADGAYCLKPYELLVGAKCGSGQTCLHRMEGSQEFVSSDVACLNLVCQCRQGLTQDGTTCRRFRPGEYGCYSNADCSGDSVCSTSRYCICPAGHKEVTSGKCGRTNARTDIGEGGTCDEILNKNKFCAEGLECVRCGEVSNFKCRKYRSSRPSSSTCSQSNSAPRTTLRYPSAVVTVVPVQIVLAFLWRYVHHCPLLVIL